jgi:hypothetical protein
MADDLIPDDVKEFILENIDSVAQLEGLPLLRGNPDDRNLIDADGAVLALMYPDRTCRIKNLGSFL